MDVEKYLLVLLLAHVLGDFYFQTEKIAKAKTERYAGVLVHSLEYLIVSIGVMIPIISTDMLLASLYLSLIHFFIDSVKYMLIKKKKVNKVEQIFVWDQLFHILSMLFLSYIMFCWNFKISSYPIINDICNAYGIEKMMLVR